MCKTFRFVTSSSVFIAAELMILGFISLTLVFSQYYIAEICIPLSVANTMWPCLKEEDSKTKETRRRLLSERRVLASKVSKCIEVTEALLLSFS